MSTGDSDAFIAQVEQMLADAARRRKDLSRMGVDTGTQPELRKSPLEETQVFRVRMDLEVSDPLIWRRLDIRSNVFLDELHQIIQSAFFWDDYHLHRFAIGAPVFQGGQEFLCGYDASEGDEGTPVEEVRLDETMQNPGDTLHYLYDYGDSWEITLTLEEVLHPDPTGDYPEDAVCIGGERAAPPEDHRGAPESVLKQMLGDLEYFDPAEVNDLLIDDGPRAWLQELESPVGDLLSEMLLHRIRMQIQRTAVTVARSEPFNLSTEEKAAALEAHRWFLDQAKGGGIPLTAAGYLKPDVVSEAAEAIPTAGTWIGKKNREDQTVPVLLFRQSMQKMGVLRKYQGQLLLTRKGLAARRSTEALWDQVAAGLVLGKPEEFTRAVAVLDLLAIAAADDDGRADFSLVTDGLDAMGWRKQNGFPLTEQDFYHQADRPRVMLQNVHPGQREYSDDGYSRAAVALARDAPEASRAACQGLSYLLQDLLR